MPNPFVLSLLTPLELIERIAALVPPPRTHRHRSSVCWHRTRRSGQASRPWHRRTVSESEVAFTVRCDTKGGKRLERLPGTEFVRRFVLHILPTGVKRTRHYGVLASACKGVKLPAAQLALQVPAANPQAIESAQAFMARVAKMDVGLCPWCKVGRLRAIAVLAGLGRLPGPHSTVAPHICGPP